MAGGPDGVKDAQPKGQQSADGGIQNPVNGVPDKPLLLHGAEDHKVDHRSGGDGVGGADQQAQKNQKRQTCQQAEVPGEGTVRPVVKGVEGQSQDTAQQGPHRAVDGAVEPAPKAGAHAEDCADAGKAGVAVQQIIADDDDGGRQKRQPQLDIDAFASGQAGAAEGNQMVHDEHSVLFC